MNSNHIKNNTATIGLFISGKSEGLRQNIRQVTECCTDMEVLGESDLGIEAYNRICAAIPRVLLIDSTPPFSSSMELAQKIASNLPQTSIIVATPSCNDDELFQATIAGASAYIHKDIVFPQLIECIRRVADGQCLLTEHFVTKSRVLHRSIRHFHALLRKENEFDPINKPLSRRETQVLTYVACGYGNKQIARCLGLKENTINNHTTAILKKLDVRNRTQAVLRAIEYGWISASAVVQPDHTSIPGKA